MTCANCNRVFSTWENQTSLTDEIDRGITLIDGLAEVFFLEPSVYQMFSAVNAPKLCRFCQHLLKHAYRFRAEFVELCHSEGLISKYIKSCQKSAGVICNNETCGNKGTPVPKNGKDNWSQQQLHQQVYYSNGVPGSSTTTVADGFHQSQDMLKFNDSALADGDFKAELNTVSVDCDSEFTFVEQSGVFEEFEVADLINDDKSVNGELQGQPESTSSDSSEHVCNICSKVFEFKALLLCHMQVDHEGKGVPTKDRYKCSICGLILAHRGTLTFHLYTHTNERPFKCTFEGCKFGAARQIRLQQHIQFAHTTEESVDVESDASDQETQHGLFLCRANGCSKKYSAKAHLLAHVAIRHTPANRNGTEFHCQFCDFSTPRSQNFTSHMFIHTGENEDGDGDDDKEEPTESTEFRFDMDPDEPENLAENPSRFIPKGKPTFFKNELFCQCIQCGFSTTSKAHHIAHFRSHCPSLYKCELCTVVFSYKYNLQRHMQNVHLPKNSSSSISQPKKRKYTTKRYVERTSTSKNKSRWNMYIETLRPPLTFQCEENGCGDSFRFKAELMLHMSKLHPINNSKKAGFQCRYCDFKRSSVYPTTAVRHMFIHTREIKFRCKYPDCKFDSFCHSIVRKHVEEHLV